jgi:hypothetical protein
MAKSKLSVSLDPSTMERARALVDVSSVSELLDVALHRLIETEEERRHIDGYVRVPDSGEFHGLATTPRKPLNDDVDWGTLYGHNEKARW